MIIENTINTGTEKLLNQLINEYESNEITKETREEREIRLAELQVHIDYIDSQVRY